MATIRTNVSDMANEGDVIAQGTIRAEAKDSISSGVNNSTIRVNEDDIPAGISLNSTIRDNSVTIKSGLQNITSFHDVSGDDLILNGIKYQYVKPLSKTSGEAEVHLVLRDNTHYVFKLYLPNFTPEKGILDQLKSLNHPDIINLVDFGYYQERFYEIMDYAEGGTLDRYLPIRDIDVIKSIINETINAFNYCHSRNIIHKDIKPENIFLKNSDGTDILLGDFGISTLLDSGMTRQLKSQNLTVGYAAPEMYGFGGKVYVGKEVDYYALGMTIIHIWLGKSPFDGLGIHAIANLTTAGNIPIPEDMPIELKNLLKGLLVNDYRKRWGYRQVTNWLNGINELVEEPPELSPTVIYKFAIAGRQNIAVRSIYELTSVMKRHPDYAKKNLFRGHIINWLNTFNPVLSAKIKNIVEDEYVDDPNAALQKTIYTVNEEEPFIGVKGARCYSPKEICKEIRENKDYYSHNVFNDKINLLNHPLFLYIEARGSKKQADYLRNFATNLDSKRAVLVVSYILDGASPEDITDFITFSLSAPNTNMKSLGASVVDDYNAAISYFAETGKASVSLLENKFSFGYHKAAFFIKRMEQEGFIGESEDTEAIRPVFINKINGKKIETKGSNLDNYSRNAQNDDEFEKYYSKALDIWANTGSFSPQDISAQLGISYSLASRICDEMKKDGLDNEPDFLSQTSSKSSSYTLRHNISRFWLVTVIGIFFAWIYFSPSSSSSNRPASQVLTVKTEANLRSGPSKNDSVVSIVKVGESLNVISKDGNWYRVVYNNPKNNTTFEGYINKNVVE